MEQEIQKCVKLLEEGKVILYPTDTVWGIGCDATNKDAVQRIYDIKQRQESKSMLILLDKEDKLPLYVKRIPLITWDLLPLTDRPTTFIYPNAQNLPDIITGHDGSIAIRIVKSGFCQQLIKAFGKPIVSTSANISGTPAPSAYADISPIIHERMDYVVPKSYDASTFVKPSRIIKLTDDYNFTIVRE